MEHDSYRQIAWYWTFLFSLFTVAVVGLVFWNNPYLYDQTELKKALTRHRNEISMPIPSPAKQRKLAQARGEPVTESFAELTHSGVDLSGQTWGHQFYDVNTTALKLKQSDAASMMLIDSDLFLLKTGALAEIDSHGHKLWEFVFSKTLNSTNTSLLFEPAFDQAAVYVALRSGPLYSFVRSSGDLIWTNQLGLKMRSRPFLIEDKLYVLAALSEGTLAKATSKLSSSRTTRVEKDLLNHGAGLNLISIKRAHGEVDKIFPSVFELQDRDSLISLNETAELLFVTQDTKVFCYELATMKLQWQTTLPAKALGPVMVDGQNVYAATETGQILAFSDERGRKLWEVDLELKLLAPPTLIPSHFQLAVIGDDHTLNVLDERNGEKKWHFQLDTTLAPWMFAIRLNGNSVTETKLKWIHKGWTLAAPCMRTRVCLFNPENGQVVGRIPLHGSPIVRPALIEPKAMQFLTAGTDSDLKFETIVDRGSYQHWSKQHGKGAEDPPHEDSF